MFSNYNRVKLTVLTTWLILTSTSVLCQFQMIDFKLHFWVPYSASLHAWWFWLNTRHCEFYLFLCWIFLHFYKCSWALLWNAVKLLRNGLPFQIPVLSFVRPEQRSAKTLLVFPSTKERFSELSIQYSMNYKFVLSLVDRDSVADPMWALKTIPSNLLGDSFPESFPGMDAVISSLLNIRRGPSADLFHSLCILFSSILCCVNTSHFGLPRLSSMPSQVWESSGMKTLLRLWNCRANSMFLISQGLQTFISLYPGF